MTETYARNLLSNVVCRTDFPVNLRLGGERPIEFQERLAKYFPKASEGVLLQAEVPGGDPQNVTLKQPVIRWEFHARDMKSHVTLQRDFLALETQQYTDFAEFRDLFMIPFDLLREIYRPAVITRLGLRYQNHVDLKEGNELDWAGFLVPQLVGHLGFDHDRVLTKDTHRLWLDSGEVHINFSYGVHNPDQPGPIRQRQFILDIDCYIRDDIELDDLGGKLAELNEEATDVFERSIGDGWRALMRA